MKYVDVVVDTKSDSVDDFFTYLSEDDDIQVGTCVEIPFSRSRARTGYVFAVHDSMPEGLEGKRLLHVRAEIAPASLPEEAVRVAVWMRRRYFCRYIDAVNCFLPTGGVPAVCAEWECMAEAQQGQEADAASLDAAGVAGEPDASEADATEIGRGVLPELSDEQQAAYDSIAQSLAGGGKDAFLLHGVTGSGKTEVYLRCAQLAVEAGRKVILLVPEISLTPQLTQRFTDRFGAGRIAVLHSRRTKKERAREWLRIRQGRVDIAIGARSAVFAPFGNLGLILIDEEHETSYKSDMQPKYDAIEIALRRAARAGSVCVLGSATPSIVTMFRAKQGFYKELRLTKRFGGTPLPRIRLVDMRTELMQGNRSIFSAKLHARIAQDLEEGKQAILFLNRRGYSPFVSCRRCGYVARCSDCGIAMTWHKQMGLILCHFCGRSAQVPKVCPECGSGYLRHFGVGTEQVEEQAATAWPGARIARLDLDTAARKGSTERILKDFGKGRTDILIGTQMVAKGLDFAHVGTVGVIAADVGLNIPDFRSCERTYALVTQVAGRAGRREERGEVVIQT
ncbi:MAG: primosomal protein N', partial [Clostridiales Family XIII bacterium]|nr:primosomal protein N' [Clostridiales Family XIII bacterium]